MHRIKVSTHPNVHIVIYKHTYVVRNEYIDLMETRVFTRQENQPIEAFLTFLNLDPLRLEEVPQPRDLLLELPDELGVGVLVDDGLADNLLGPGKKKILECNCR